MPRRFGRPLRGWCRVASQPRCRAHRRQPRLRSALRAAPASSPGTVYPAGLRAALKTRYLAHASPPLAPQLEKFFTCGGIVVEHRSHAHLGSHRPHAQMAADGAQPFMRTGRRHRAPSKNWNFSHKGALSRWFTDPFRCRTRRNRFSSVFLGRNKIS